MHRKPINAHQHSIWFWLGLASIVIGSAMLRFWQLGRFNTLVFDEIYYARFASDFLNGIPTFGGHPPFCFYLIAIAIWIAQHTPIGDGDLKNGLSGMLLSPVSYRWLNAVIGTLLPVLIAAIAYQLTRRRSYALIAALLAALDGIFLVDSRYALNNIHLIGFGLLGHALLFAGVQRSVQQGRSLWLALAGICLGLSVAVKWNGLGFLLGIYLCWGIAWIGRWQQRLKRERCPVQPSAQGSRETESPIQKLVHLNGMQVLIYLVVVPAIAYSLSWIPYMRLDPATSFWQWQAEILQYHGDVGGMDAHPYCSPWYSWLVMWRPIAYFYKAAHGMNEPPPIVGPPLPSGTAAVVYDVHAMANPLLLWGSTVAILLIAGMLLRHAWSAVGRSPLIAQVIKPAESSGARRSAKPRLAMLTVAGWTMIYLVVNHGANWLPWVISSRCTFFYHYMESMVFAWLALAWFIDRGWRSPEWGHRVASIGVLIGVAIAFYFWLPLYLGLPLSPEAFQGRLWFRSWI
jgi:dolichyl-phosphate-mannose--protein O-mannosyl transferase